MSIYQDYIKEIDERKTKGLAPLPIDGSELLSEIISQIKDTGNEHRADSLNFFIYNTLPGTTAAAGVKAEFLKAIILGEAVVEEITEVVSEDSAAPTQELQDEALEQEETVPTAESQTVDAQAQTAVREETAVVAPMKEVVDVVSVLRTALKDLQKINAFMTDIDVRQNVTMEELVPVVPTDDERYAAINVSYAQVKADHQLIAYAVTSGLANEKIQLGYKTLQTMVQNIDAALSLGNISQAESLTKEALLLSSDMRTLLGDIELPAEPEVTEGKATTTSATTEEVMRG